MKNWIKGISKIDNHLLRQFVKVVLIVVAITNPGCNPSSKGAPTDTISPPLLDASSTPSSCIVGIWEINDVESFLMALVPVGAFEPGQLEFVKTIGSVAYRFDNKGIVTVEAVSFQGRIDVKEERTIGILDIRMQGFAFGRFQLNGDQIQLTDLIESDMSFNAYYAGEDMMSDSKADDFLPLFVPPYNSARFECDANKLMLHFANHPNIPNSLEFKRLR